MKFAYYLILPVLILIISACGDNNKGGKDDPVYSSNPQIKAITEKINDDPGNAALYYQRGVLLNNIEQDSMAMNDFKKAASLDSTKAEYFSAIGDILFEHKDISGSVQWLQKALKLNPEDTKAQLKLAKMFVYIKEYTSAFNAINTVLRQDVYNPEGYFLKGMIYKDLKDTAKAISSFLTAIQVAPEYKDAIIQLGLLYSAKGDPIALKYLQNAWRLDTLDAFPLFARGVFYQHKKELELAKEEYKNTIYHDRQYVDAYFNMANILLEQDSLDKALRQYNILAQIDQTDPEVYYYRGKCYEKMGKTQEAIADYKQAIVFDEKFTEAREALSRIEHK